MGKGFEVSGVFTNTILRANGAIGLVMGSFKLWVDGDKWRIRTIRNDEFLDYIEAGSTDRRQIYLLESFSNYTAKAVMSEHPTNAADWSVAAGQIFSGEVPHLNSAQQISMLWLAYASGGYLSSRTNNQIEPVYWFGAQYFFNRGLTLPGDWLTEQALPHLPSRAVYHNDGLIRGTAGFGEPKITPNPAPYANGYTNAVYEASSFTELGPYRIPTAFTLKTYRLRPDGSAYNVVLNMEYNFQATNACLLAEPVEFVPRIFGRTDVRDLRFASSDGITEYFYVLTNQWPSTATVRQNKNAFPVFPGGNRPVLPAAF